MVEPDKDGDLGSRSRVNGKHYPPEEVRDHARPDQSVPHPAPPPNGAVLHLPPSTDQSQRRWFFVQLWNELRLATRMYFDPRYRISRTVQFLGPVILVLFALNYFVFSVWIPIPLVSPILERIVCVFLGVFAYQLVTRELVRYRTVLDYLATYGQR